MSHNLDGARGLIDDSESVLRKGAAWARERGVELLLADAGSVAGKDHLESAVLHAERAKRRGTMSARSLPMETLLYLSGQRQVADAIAAAGIRSGTERIAVVVFGDASAREAIEAMGWTPDPGVLRAEPKDAFALGLTRPQLSTLPRERWEDLALERTALLDVDK